jgi:hypothetical protein
MKFSVRASALALASLAAAKVIPRAAGKLPTVTSEGNAFWAGDERFFVRGVAYQPGGAADAKDPMADMDTFRNDVANFKDLGINTIRIYTVDNSINHDEAMKLLDDNGIYLALDVNSPKFSLNRESLDSLHASYNDVYLQSVFATIDAFAGYSMMMLSPVSIPPPLTPLPSRQPPPVLLRQRGHQRPQQHQRRPIHQGRDP